MIALADAHDLDEITIRKGNFTKAPGYHFFSYLA